MERTHFHVDHRRIVRGRAYSYAPKGQGYEASPLNYANAGATSLFTTAPDLAQWLDNFREPKVGGRGGIIRLQEQAVLNDGRKIGYALGVSVGEYRGLKTVSHGGADAGYRSFVLWLPEQETGIVVLGNFSTFVPAVVAQRIAAVYFEGRMGPEPKPAVTSAVRRREGNGNGNNGDVAGYSGVYWSEELETQYTVREKSGRLFLDHAKHGEVTMTRVDKDTFRSGHWFMQDVTFVRNSEGRLIGFRAGGGRVRRVEFARR